MPFKDKKMAAVAKSDYKLRVRGQLKVQVLRYLADHPCVDCGELDPIVLEFDHLKDKTRSIANLVNDCASWERIEAEIAKCVVRCANCHKRKTASELGYWKQLSGIV